MRYINLLFSYLLTYLFRFTAACRRFALSECCLFVLSIACVDVLRTCAECADNVTITPYKECVRETTALTCSATYGNPGSPSYYWTNLTGMANVSYSESYTVSQVGFYYLQCTAQYTHVCPEHHAACHENITIRVFGQCSVCKAKQS